MPSIPQSLLWISLVVLWLFVLVPMLINKRDTVRRTSDVALATRVLNSGRSRLARRGGPATGHRHDPNWQRDPTWSRDGVEPDDDADAYEAEDYEREVREAVREAQVRSHTRAVMVVASVTEEVTAPAGTAEPDYLDVDVVDENSGALPVGAGVQDSLFEAVGHDGDPEIPEADTDAADAGPEASGDADDEDARGEVRGEVGGEADGADPADVTGADAASPSEREPDDGLSDEYEYVEDTSGLEAEQEPMVSRSNRRRRLDSSAAAAVSARKFRFRKRVLTAMAAVMALTAGLAFALSPALWWACGATAGITVLYLAYLRRQTRIEEQVRRRRQQRMARTRMAEGFGAVGPEYGGGVDGSDFDMPSRLRRPGAVVLDIDDEDPTFEHLDEVAYSRRYDLPRASGQ